MSMDHHRHHHHEDMPVAQQMLPKVLTELPQIQFTIRVVDIPVARWFRHRLTKV